MRQRSRVLLAVLAVLAATLVPGAAAANTERTAIPGLSAPVDIAVDNWGVPHISAANTGDLFQAQGFNAARDRLFQMDTWRRRGLGELSKVLGPDYLDQDRAARLFLYRGDMAEEWASYGPEAKRIATRFAAGVNAYVDWLGRHPAALPEEFRELGYSPAHWRPEDLVRIRTHALVSNLSGEIDRARFSCLGGARASELYKRLQPRHRPQVPAGLDPCSIPDDVAKVYELATDPVKFEHGKPSSGMRRGIDEANSGSNSWAIAPDRTTTGRPILAGDPHRDDADLPANRYIAHLSAPGLNIIGAGEPWNPGISMGHNENIAFGLTNIPADQSDLYVYDLKPGDPSRYRYQGHWESMRTTTERIPVAGGDPRPEQLSFTRHGPVIKVDRRHNKAYAVRTVWSQPGTSAYLGSLNFQRAKNFGEFAADMRTWKTPGSNLVFAGKDGDIGWVPGAIVPRRSGPGYDGLLPVPGDGRYEWQGFHSNAELPRVHNPAAGFFASANDYNFRGATVQPGYEWSAEYRKDRIDEVLSGAPRSSVADSMRLQNDERSGLARVLLPYLRELRTTDPVTGRALALLRGFDGVVGKDSAPAALYETWLMRFLYPGWAHTLLPKPAADAFVEQNTSPDFRVLTDTLADPGRWFGANGAAKRDALLRESLRAAFLDARAKLGPDPARWRWGSMHQHTFHHPLGGPDVGPVAQGGDAHTVRAAAYDYSGFPYQQTHGPTFKMVQDVGAWDNSRAINAPGQSGDRRSPHYRDLAGKWADGKYFPLLYSKAAIAPNVRAHILLTPGGSAGGR
ncbi:penicillin acylase family protein [Sciscionella sediminilitoris]|uniref:penicillin acylase family protein n=1 Tax=Sciscionella sediminilitoris TaxID=1445613 RepID=UPI0004DF5D15|nr:penicillin acylase family protein [Sciscionella sp. SE31]